MSDPLQAETGVYSVALAGSRMRFGLGSRVAFLALLLSVEWVPILIRFSPGSAGSELLIFGAICGTFFLAAGYAKARGSLPLISSELARVPVRWGLLAAHFGFLSAFLYLSALRETSPPGIAVALLRCVTGILLLGSAGFAAIPAKFVWKLLLSTGSAWAAAVPAGVAAGALVSLPRVGDMVWNWHPVTGLTFYVVKVLLYPFLPQMVADRATVTIGSASFSVTIGAPCSGWEGAALMLVFSVSWLCFRRREFRFPGALLLIPAAMLATWILNAVRIASLILIGVAGAPEVAMNGFHSQSGWILFNSVALGFVAVSPKMPWFSSRAVASPIRKPLSESATAAYLMPLLAILAAAMISKAASSGFEWLYPLRPGAAVAALWFFRSQYKKMNWRFGWSAVFLGGAAFAIWLGLALLSSPHGSSPTSESGTGVWLACRIAAALTTVPIAEELAFRGFLIRYLVPRRFELSLSCNYTYLAIAISSVAFGILHGSHWIAATIAGLLYAVAFCRRQRIGDAVAAHITTNALLLMWVLKSGDWSSW